MSLPHSWAISLSLEAVLQVLPPSFKELLPPLFGELLPPPSMGNYQYITRDSTSHSQRTLLHPRMESWAVSLDRMMMMYVYIYIYTKYLATWKLKCSLECGSNQKGKQMETVVIRNEVCLLYFSCIELRCMLPHYARGILFTLPGHGARDRFCFVEMSLSSRNLDWIYQK